MAKNSGQILIIGEQLRLRMHEEPGLVGDRRYHFRTYSGCIVGKEAVDWMVKMRDVTSRENAVKCMRLLQDNGVLHHVCDDHVFKDEHLFYKFRVDDGSMFIEPELEVYSRGIMLHQRILASDENFLTLSNNIQRGRPFASFSGNDFITWVVDNDVLKERADAAFFGDQLLKAGIIKGVQANLDFQDDESMYQFVFDIKPNVPLYKALGFDSDCDLNGHKLLADAVERLGLSPGQNNYLHKLWAGKNEPVISEDNASRSSSEDSDNTKATALKSVVLRHMSSEELTGKNSPYVPRNVRIMGDSVGFGFVVRGEGPCYVQTVDPSGPAASAGLKIRQYIQCVNGKDALRLNHKEVAKEIMRGPIVDLVILVHFRSITHE